MFQRDNCCTFVITWTNQCTQDQVNELHCSSAYLITVLVFIFSFYLAVCKIYDICRRNLWWERYKCRYSRLIHLLISHVTWHMDIDRRGSVVVCFEKWTGGRPDDRSSVLIRPPGRPGDRPGGQSSSVEGLRLPRPNGSIGSNSIFIFYPIGHNDLFTWLTCCLLAVGPLCRKDNRGK